MILTEEGSVEYSPVFCKDLKDASSELKIYQLVVGRYFS
jgi:hypothetical protein